jgi:hypothetical protein
LLLGLASIWLAACQSQPNQVFIEVDGRRQALATEATTVREALGEAQIVLEPLDRVHPDLYVKLEPGLVIVVTRVTEQQETVRQIVPFERQTIVNEALNPGESRLAQLGVTGEEEITIRVIYEDGQEVSRQEIGRAMLVVPAPEILVIGPQGQLPPAPVKGTVAYLSHGNIWLIRDNSDNRRALTAGANLDGRVLTLSPDGQQLLYTSKITDEMGLPLNEVWLASTTIIDEPPVKLNLSGLLWAEWAPQSNLVAFSTAERTANPPGWQANNDLWLLEIPADLSQTPPSARQLIPANTQGLYAWWGSHLSWSPDGQKLAYARADQVGVIDLSLTSTLSLSQSYTTLADFSPVQTFSEWVWLPRVSWSPDGRFLATVLHGLPLAGEPAEESQVFDLWLLSVDGQIKAKVAEQVGMWANPVWGQLGVAFGQALEPLQSVNSRYTLQFIDRDGSNKRQLFPFRDGVGVQLPEMLWSDTGDQLLFVHSGNLYLTGLSGGPPRQLTSDSQVTKAQWVVKQAALITTSQPITTSPTVTRSGALPDIRATSTVITLTQTVEVTKTPEIQPSPTPVNILEQLRGE